MKPETRKKHIEEIVESLTSEQVKQEIVAAKIKIRYGSVDLVREVCKLSSMRKRFSLARYNGRPFWDVDGSRLNPLQMKFLQWLKFYENIDESMDRPPDRIVYNDNLLLGWLEEQHKKMENRYEENWMGDSYRVGKKASDHQEVFQFDD